MTDPWAAADARARTLKRAAFEWTRRAWKIAGERIRNAGVTTVNVAMKRK